MNIQLTINNKEVRSPEFKLMYGQGDDYLIVLKKIKKSERDEISEAIKNNQAHIEFEDQLIILNLQDKYYSFNIPDFEKVAGKSKGKDFGIGFAFLDENDKIIKAPITFFYMQWK